MEGTTPGYYAIIPADVLHDEALSANAKLFYAQITALTNAEGYCWAGNDFFVEKFKFSERTVTRLISELEKQKYIIRDVIKDKDGKVIQRRIYLRESAMCGLPPDKIVGWFGQNCLYPPDKNGGENNIDNNIKKRNIKEKKKAEPLTEEQLKKIFSDWITEIASESWSRDIKNRLWFTLCAFYEPRVNPKNNPEPSLTGVNGLKRSLLDYSGRDPLKMCMILDKAITCGYRGIFPLDKPKANSVSNTPDTAPGGEYIEI